MASPQVYHEPAVLLDPVENNSSQPFREPVYERGRYHRQYLHAATDGVWGQHGASCGGDVLVNEEDDKVTVRPVLCDTWACPLCGPRRAAWLKRELKLAQGRHGLDWFVTLTIRVGTCTPAESDELITRAFDKLQQRIRRRYGKFSYVWIREHTEAGYAHLHVLISLEVDQVWLSDAWLACTGGSWIVDVEPVASERAGDYLAKYCTQQAQDRAKPAFAHLAGKRFFSKSRDVQFAPFRGESERVEALDERTGELVAESRYERLQGGYWGVVATYVAQGWEPTVQRVLGVPYAVLQPVKRELHAHPERLAWEKRERDRDEQVCT